MHLELWSAAGGSYHKAGVSRENYRTLAPGTLVDIEEHEGAFGQKWFTIHYNGKELNDVKSYFVRNKQEVPWGSERP